MPFQDKKNFLQWNFEAIFTHYFVQWLWCALLCNSASGRRSLRDINECSCRGMEEQGGGENCVLISRQSESSIVARVWTSILQFFLIRDQGCTNLRKIGDMVEKVAWDCLVRETLPKRATCLRKKIQDEVSCREYWEKEQLGRDLC